MDLDDHIVSWEPHPSHPVSIGPWGWSLVSLIPSLKPLRKCQDQGRNRRFPC